MTRARKWPRGQIPSEVDSLLFPKTAEHEIDSEPEFDDPPEDAELDTGEDISALELTDFGLRGADFPVSDGNGRPVHLVVTENGARANLMREDQEDDDAIL